MASPELFRTSSGGDVLKTAIPKPSRHPLIIVMVLVCAVTLFLRILPWHSVFNGQYISFLEGDSYNQMYYAKMIVAMPFWSALHFTFSHNLLWSGTIALLSHVGPIEVVGALLPLALAVGTVIMVYLIGVTLWNRTVGVLGALFVGIIPSEFLHRSFVGFADHHVAEVFLVSVVVLLIARTLKSGHASRKLMLASAGALFLYVANWAGGLSFVLLTGLFGFVVLGWIIIVRRQPWRRLAWTVGSPVVVAMAAYLPLGGWAQVSGLFPHASSAVSGLSVGTQQTIEGLSTFLAPVNQRTIAELMPLFNPQGRGFDPRVVVLNLHLFAPAFLIGLALLWKFRRERAMQFFVVWTIAVLAMALNNRRFLYYLTIPVGLISAYLIYWLSVRIRGSVAFNASFLAVPFIVLSVPLATMLGLGQFNQMPADWYATLQWMNKQPIEGQVTAWGDYGHWIAYETKFTPNLLPGPGGRDVARLFLSSDETEERALLKKLDTQYLIVDADTLNWKTAALVTISERPEPAHPTDTLIWRLSNIKNVPDFLRLDYEVHGIKVYRAISGARTFG